MVVKKSQDDPSNLPDLDEELNERITLLANPSNQGEPLDSKDYFLLFLVGLIGPVILIGIGWWL